MKQITYLYIGVLLVNILDVVSSLICFQLGYYETNLNLSHYNYFTFSVLKLITIPSILYLIILFYNHLITKFYGNYKYFPLLKAYLPIFIIVCFIPSLLTNFTVIINHIT